MHTALVTYADANMLTSQELCVKSAYEKAKITATYKFHPEHIDPFFARFNKDILDKEQRGGGRGYWLWKPYFCYEVIAASQLGDYVIYADSGIEFLKPLDSIFQVMEQSNQNIFLFGNSHNHFNWCKKEVAQHMLKLSDLQVKCESYKEQVQASVIIFKVNIFSKDFCKRWLAWSQIPGFIDDNSAYEQLSEYSAHRNDQSILTNLAIADRIKLHWWPTQYGMRIKDKYADDWYDQLFYHHRYREEDWKNCGLTIDQFMNQNKTI